MSDDVGKSGYPDRARINMDEAWEVTYWTRTLGVTKDRLAALVKEVGPLVANVKKKLGI
jgi:hypothetical protein